MPAADRRPHAPAGQLDLFAADTAAPRLLPDPPKPLRPDATPPRRPDTHRPPGPPMQHYDDGIHRFDWSLHRLARRTLALRVDDRGVSVLAPRAASSGSIAELLRTHAAWVQRKLRQRELRLQALRAARIDWRDGGHVPYLGQQITLRLRGAPQPHWDAAAAELHLPLPPDGDAQQLRDSVAAWMQRQALALFSARVAHYAALLGVRVAAVKLSSAMTRWGSASRDGSIRLHWRLLHFSPQLVDYVVAHEVAHLREMNHSPRFWAHVGSLYPEYQQARRELRHATLPPWD